MRIAALLSLLGLVGVSYAQTNSHPALARAWAEKSVPVELGRSGYQMFDMPANSYTYSDGIYRSALSRITFRMPFLGQEDSVSVREGIVSRRSDGTLITSKVVMVPGQVNVLPDPLTNAASIVVTLLRDDRPKDRESVFRGWEPQTSAERENLDTQGVFYTRRETHMGSAIQMQVLNRIYTKDFPFDKKVRNVDGVQSIGTTFVLVVEDESLIELSQIFPCKTLSPVDCRKNSLEAAENFLAGLLGYSTYPRSKPKNEQ